MNRDAVLKKLLKHRVELESRFGVKSLSLFGSIARNEAVSASDLDILVSFINTPGIFGFINLKLYLENLFKCPVDLVTNNALKKQLREQILQEAIYAF
jgi:predicted nucleotidyltransferase